MTAREAIELADTDPDVITTSADRGRLRSYAEAKPPFTWQIGYYDGDTEVVQVLIDDPTRTIRESWTGYQVAWQMARGNEGQFGHLLNAPYVWIPLALLFFFGLFDFRRPRKWVHLDLLVLLSFGVSQFFFDRGDIGVSVPLVYPPLVYLLCRMLWIGFKGQRDGLNPSAPLAWLAIATMFLIGFRVALNVADSGVIDVGYAGVIGADRAVHGDPLYGEGAFPDDNPFGDTYGPANSYAYVPFELAMPWDGDWDELPAAHGAAIFFDLATIAGLFFLGRRLRRPAPEDSQEEAARAKAEGTALGVTLAFAWCAYPYTTYALQSNSNDSLVAALLVWAFVAFASPVGRGVLLGLASMVKFAPLALAPLFAVGERGLLDRFRGDGKGFGLKPIAVFTVAFAATIALVLTPTILDPGLPTFYERTLENQLDRESPFSIWGQESGLDWLQTIVRIAALVLAMLVAFVPRRRSLPQLAALASAVLIASQLGIDHWFYLYLPWFVGLSLVGLLDEPDRAQAG
jgi:Glycosyltransferase family 87